MRTAQNVHRPMSQRMRQPCQPKPPLVVRILQTTGWPESCLDGMVGRACRQAIEACGGDLWDTVKALIVANEMLERELSEVYAKATSYGFIRGRRAKPKL